MADEPAAPAQDDPFSIYIARQPIFDRDMQVIAYELLFRDADAEDASIPDPDVATARVLTHATTDFDLNSLLDGKLAFINFTRNLLISTPAFDHQQFVIEIGDQVTIDEALISGIRTLWGQGYLVSLDGYTPGGARDVLLPYTRYVALNAQALAPDAFKQAYDQLRDQHPGIDLIAEKVESAKLVKLLWKLGVDAFRGYFFCRPEVIEGARIPDNKMVVLKLLSELRQPDVSMEALEQILIRDSALSYKLLRLVNSAAFRRASAVESISHALSMLGLDRVRSWVSMLALCDLGDKPEELQLTAITRARACELVAKTIGANQEQYFTLGLFSLLDAFFDKPMDQLLQSVTLAPDIAAALTSREGPMGTVLASVVYQERGRWQDIDKHALEELGASVRIISDAFLQASEWARDTAQEMQAESRS